MIDKRENTIVRYLKEIAKPEIYINNAFRLTRLDVSSSLREAKKFIRAVEQSRQLKLPFKYADSAYFPISSTTTVEDLKLAVDQKLSDSFKRLIEELFWFWPFINKSAAEDKALLQLKAHNPDGAAEIWKEALNSRANKIIALHNLAVLYHLRALEKEQEILKRKELFYVICPKCNEYFSIFLEDSTITECPNCQTRLKISTDVKQKNNKVDHLLYLWKEAYKYWGTLYETSGFWTFLTKKAGELDRNIDEDFIEEIKHNLLSVLIAINSSLLIDYALAERRDEASLHLDIIFASGFGEDHITSCLKEATNSIFMQIYQASESCEQNSKKFPKEGLKEVEALLKTAAKGIGCIELINTKLEGFGAAVCDTVADSAQTGLANYVNETHDYEAVLNINESLLSIAKGQVTKNRISENVRIIRSSIENAPMYSLLEKIEQLCASIMAEIKALGAYEKSKPRVIQKEFDTNVVPLVTELVNRYGDESEDIKEILNLCAVCLRQIALALNNIGKSPFEALKAIRFAQKIVKDIELSKALMSDAIVLNNNIDVRKENSSNWKDILTGIGILVFIALMASVCPDSEGKKYKSDISPSNPTASYTTNADLSTESSRNNNQYIGQNERNLTRLKLKEEIEANRAKIERLETELESLSRTLDNYKASLNFYEAASMIDEYNNLVPTYNLTVSRYKSLYNDYQKLINETNQKIKAYNEGT